MRGHSAVLQCSANTESELRLCAQVNAVSLHVPE